MAVKRDGTPLFNPAVVDGLRVLVDAVDHKQQVFTDATVDDFRETLLHHYPKGDVYEIAYDKRDPVWRGDNAQGERVGVYNVNSRSFALRIPR